MVRFVKGQIMCQLTNNLSFCQLPRPDTLAFDEQYHDDTHYTMHDLTVIGGLVLHLQNKIWK